MTGTINQQGAKNLNSFYKNVNSSVSSTDLVATKRFSNVLLDKELAEKQNRMSADTQTISSSTKISPVSLSDNNVHDRVQNNSSAHKGIPEDPLAVKNLNTYLSSNISTKQKRNNNGVMNKISMFENSNNDNSNFRPVNQLHRSEAGFRSKIPFDNTKNSHHQVLSLTYPKLRTKLREVQNFYDLSDKENSIVNGSKAIQQKSKGALFGSSTQEDQTIPDNKTSSSQTQIPDDTLPIAASLFLSSPSNESTSPVNTSVNSSIFTVPRIKKNRNYVSTAFTHDPIYSKSTSYTDSIKSSSGSLSKSENNSLPRTLIVNSIASEKPLLDLSRNLNVSSSASITGSMLSERPLCDVTSDSFNDDETIYHIDKSKSSNSILSESLFENHQFVNSSLSSDMESTTNKDTNSGRAAVSKLVQSPSVSSRTSQMPKVESVDQKLNEFLYLFNVDGTGNAKQKEKVPTNRIIASSLVRSHLNEPPIVDMPDLLKISKVNNTVRFNEEITEYEHPEIFYEEDSEIIDTLRDGSTNEILCIGGGIKTDGNDNKLGSSLPLDFINNAESGVNSDTNDTFNSSSASSAVKKALESASRKAPNKLLSDFNSAELTRNSANASRASNRSASIIYSQQYKTGYSKYETSRMKRRSSFGKSYRSQPGHLLNSGNNSKSLSHLPLDTSLAHEINDHTSAGWSNYLKKISFKKTASNNSSSKELNNPSFIHSDIFSPPWIKKHYSGSSASSQIRAASVQSSRVSFTSAASKINKKFSSVFSSRRNSKHDFGEHEIKEGPVHLMHNPLVQSAVNDLERVYGEGHTRHHAEERRKSRHSFDMSSKRSIRSVGTHFKKNFSTLSISKLKDTTNNYHSVPVSSSKPTTKTKNTVDKKTISLFSTACSKITSWF